MLVKRKQERNKEAAAENFQLENPEAFEAESMLDAMNLDDQATLDNELDGFFSERSSKEARRRISKRENEKQTKIIKKMKLNNNVLCCLLCAVISN